MSKIIGIDLGTSNSAAAAMVGGKPTIIQAAEGTSVGGKAFPSVVAFTREGQLIVGEPARRQMISNAEGTVLAAKRKMGTDFKFNVFGKQYTPQQISAFILQKIKRDAEAFLGETVNKAVITVPAYFNDNQRQATKDAGEIAGLDVIRIINEPTAAALSYGFGRNVEKTVAVYDFGGGTFDISILEIGQNGVFKVIATAGDTFLGGEDVDARIIDWLVQNFREENGIDLRQDRMALQRLRDAAEKAKCDLSGVKETEVNLPFIISSGRNEALHLQRSLTRATLEELAGDLVERTIDICQQTLEEARLDKDEIEEVILVGGMTRMPKIQQAVASFFEREPCKGVHPDEVVALGAAIQGAALVATDQKQQMILLDVTPHPLGIMTVGNV